MKSPFLTKGGSLQQKYEDLQVRVRSLKMKNDQYQRLSNQNLDSTMAQQILEQKSMMDDQIKQTKNIIQDISEVSKQPQYRNKLKKIKEDYQAQSSRYRQISEDLLQKSVIKAEINNRRRKSQTNGRNSQRGSQRTSQTNSANLRNSSNLRNSTNFVQDQVQYDYTHEQEILKQRSKDLQNLQQRFQRVHEIHKDMGQMVNEQGTNVDIISENLLKIHKNAQGATQQLQQAQGYQKKSRKKWLIILAIIALVTILGVAGYFIYQSNQNS